jgi:hypothetical protein
MDDLKLIDKTEKKLQKQVKSVKLFIDNMQKEFGFDVCANIVFKKGQVIHWRNLILGINRKIQQLEQIKTQKYPRIEEIKCVQYQ